MSTRLTQIDVERKVRIMESRARSLRSLAVGMPPAAADAFRRRASAIELMAFVTRNRYFPMRIEPERIARPETSGVPQSLSPGVPQAAAPPRRTERQDASVA